MPNRGFAQPRYRALGSVPEDRDDRSVDRASSSTSSSTTSRHRSGDFSPQQAASELGVSRSLIYRLVERGEFPNAYHVSNRLRIPRDDVAALRERNRIRPREAPMYEPLTTSRPGSHSSSFAAELQAIKGGT